MNNTNDKAPGGGGAVCVDTSLEPNRNENISERLQSLFIQMAQRVRDIIIKYYIGSECKYAPIITPEFIVLERNEQERMNRIGEIMLFCFSKGKVCNRIHLSLHHHCSLM